MFRFALAAIFAAAIVRAADAAPPPIEAFGSLPLASQGTLSPDGKHVALIQPIHGRNGVMIYNLAMPDSKPNAVALDGAVAKYAFWKSNDRLIAIFVADLKQKWSHNIYTWSRAISVDANGQNAVLMMDGAPFLKYNTSGAAIVDRVANRPTRLYMAASEGEGFINSGFYDLYSVDITVGGYALALRGTPHTVQYLMDGYGNLWGHVEQDWNLNTKIFFGSQAIASFDAHGGRGVDVAGLTEGEQPKVAILAHDSSGMQALFGWKQSGAPETLFSDPRYDLADPIEDEHTGRVSGVTYYDDLLRSHYFDPALQHVQTLLEKAFPGQSVQILSKDETNSSYVILTDGPRNPPVLSLYTSTNHQVNILQEAYPSLKPEILGEVKPYPYTATDGLQIHAYLTLPPGKPARNLPTVIFPHGGPEARDSMDFDWWAQFMASRGYAVLQPNYRGSSGYGWNFTKAGDGEWADKVQQDLKDGVQKLAADGISDPKRVCIVGASWGGFLALGGVTFQPDVYACAVSYAGVFDLAHAVYEGTTFKSEVGTIWRRRIGADKDSSKLDSQSPVNFAERVSAPVLLIHSDKDTTVKIEQSQIEERALRHAGKQVEFVTLEGDDHYLEFAETRIKLLNEIDRFLGAHIGDTVSARQEPSSIESHPSR